MQNVDGFNDLKYDVASPNKQEKSKILNLVIIFEIVKVELYVRNIVKIFENRQKNVKHGWIQ